MESKLTNPLNNFYHKKFEKQSQDYPALQSKMKPVPEGDMKNYQGHDLLKGRHALITGGDSGIGRAVAIAYAKEGADVAIQYLPEEESDAKEVEKIIKKIGQKVILLPADFRRHGTAKKVTMDAEKKLRGLDLLVMNAAIQQQASDITNVKITLIRDTFEVNIISMFEMVQAALPHLPAGSSIIATSSVQAFQPSPNLLTYATTKAAICSFITNLAQSIAEKGIRANGVAPGPIWTPLQVCGGQPTEAVPTFGQETPLNRAGQPDEVAPLYVFLASNQANYITGQMYGITGGALTTY